METLLAERKYSKEELDLIKSLFTKGCTDEEFGLFTTLARTYQLDPFKGQLWCVKYGTGPARVFTGRDGFLEIAHRSGQFDGMESGVRLVSEEISLGPDSTSQGIKERMVGWATVYRKDMGHPFHVEVDMAEYQKDSTVWKQMPRTMIQKVAESQALRRAFSASGLYSPEEFGEVEKPAPRDITPKEEKKELASVVDAEQRQTENMKAMAQAQTRKQVKKGKVWVWEDTGEPVGKK